MHGVRVRIPVAALLIALATQPVAVGQSLPAAATASSQVSFPQLPLKRDSAPDASIVESLGWAALLLAAAGAAGFLAVQRKTWAGKGLGFKWLRAAPQPGTPKPLAHTPLTQQASLHVVEWDGEELLLGCTSHTVSLLARRPSNSVRDGPVSGDSKDTA